MQVIEGGDGAPAEPDWQSHYNDELDAAEAHSQWVIVLDDLRGADTLAIANGHAIKRLVEFRVQYERSARHVAENGPILRGLRAKIGQWNPHWSVMRQADESIRVLEAELGLAPARRGKVTKVPRGKKAPSAASRYLRSVPS